MFNARYPFSDMHWNIKSMASLFYGFPEMGMDKLLNKLGIKMDGRHHRGIDDAYNIAKILIDKVEKMDRKTKAHNKIARKILCEERKKEGIWSRPANYHWSSEFYEMIEKKSKKKGC
jgi:inhibitor of KinA sporulation pathway (predicted exonuclease)